MNFLREFWWRMRLHWHLYWAVCGVCDEYNFVCNWYEEHWRKRGK